MNIWGFVGFRFNPYDISLRYINSISAFHSLFFFCWQLIFFPVTVMPVSEIPGCALNFCTIVRHERNSVLIPEEAGDSLQAEL